MAVAQVEDVIWSQVFESLPYLVYLGDLQQQVLLSCNRNAYSGSKVANEGHIPFEQWFSYFAPDEKIQLKKDLASIATLEVGSSLQRIYRMRYEHSEWGFYHHCIAPLKNNNERDLFVGIVREVSDAFVQGRQLRESEERYRLLANNSNDLIWTTDPLLNLTYVSPSVETLSGFSFEELLFSQAPKFFPRDTNQRIKEIFETEFSLNELAGSQACALPHFKVIEQPLQCKSGKMLTVEIQLSLLYDDFGMVKGTLGVARNVTERKETENEKLLAAAVFESSREAIFITDPNGFILRTNSAFLQQTGYRSEEIIGRHSRVVWEQTQQNEFFKQVVDGINIHDNWRGECYYKRRNGDSRPCFISFSVTRDESQNIQNYVGIFMDIAEKKENEERIQRLAYYDSLTEIPNRSLFNDRLAKAIQYAERRGCSVAVLFLDLDRFKPVNDSLGHSAGDQLLRGVARRLTYCIREEDTVARMGGDEFAVVLADLPRGEDAQKIVVKTAQRIIAQFVTPFLIDGREVFTSTSVGAAISPRDGRLAEELLRNSDMAMYAAKKAGKNNYQFYDQKMNDKAMERLFIENAMRRALVNQEFLLHFQPQYRVNDRSLSGVEALLRWQHPKFGLLEPLQFIGLAEETDLIIPIGEWVFQKSCELLGQWRAKGIQLGRFSINVSATQFKRKNFADWALFQIKHYRVDPTKIELEITETILMEDVEHTLSVLSALKDAGLRIAVDDFGTGYSSLNYLRRFPIDTLKIDKSFVHDITKQSGGNDLTCAVIAIAKSLRMGVIAEGVESQEQLDFLARHGCDEVQGYFFGHPMPEQELFEMLNADSECLTT